MSGFLCNYRNGQSYVRVEWVRWSDSCELGNVRSTKLIIGGCRV